MHILQLTVLSAMTSIENRFSTKKTVVPYIMYISLQKKKKSYQLLIIIIKV